MIYTWHCDSPLGKISFAEKEGEVIGLWLETQNSPLAFYSDKQKEKQTETLCKVESWLTRYFNGQKPSPKELPLAPLGNDFRKTVWSILLKIPYGVTTSYKAVAHEVCLLLGKKAMSAQAVGNAVGHNPLPIIIPCHRVITSTGRIGGYSGGIDNKIFLLGIEGVPLLK